MSKRQRGPKARVQTASVKRASTLRQPACLRAVNRQGESNRFDILTTLGGVDLASASSTRWGGTVGVGFEYGFAPNWSAGIEYDHLFMGNSNNSFSVVNPAVAGALNRISQDVDMVTLRVNYRFGWGSPVVAKY